MNIQSFIEETNRKCSAKEFIDLKEMQKWVSSLTLLDAEKYSLINEKRYCRNVLFANQFCEIVIITWLPLQSSPFHNHPQKGCLMKVLSGALKETRRIISQNKNVEITLKKGQTYYMSNNLGIHKIENISQLKAISLHIYSPGVYQCEIFQ